MQPIVLISPSCLLKYITYRRRWNLHAKVNDRVLRRGFRCNSEVQRAHNIKKMHIDGTGLDPVCGGLQKSSVSGCVICIHGTLQTCCETKAVIIWWQYCIVFSLGVREHERRRLQRREPLLVLRRRLRCPCNRRPPPPLPPRLTRSPETTPGSMSLAPPAPAGSECPFSPWLQTETTGWRSVQDETAGGAVEWLDQTFFYLRPIFWLQTHFWGLPPPKHHNLTKKMVK